MKKQIMLLAVALSLGFGAANAQEKVVSKSTEKTNLAMEKIAVLHLGEDVNNKTKVVLTDFYNAVQKVKAEMENNDKVDRDVLKAKKKELVETRDTKLKELFTAEQFNKWKNEIEPSLKTNKEPKAEIKGE